MPAIQSVESNETLPESVDVAVIGGGIIGISAAWHLARQSKGGKLRVAVFEKGEIACEQSSRNWGYCRQQGRDQAELSLMVESMRIWRALNQDVGAETGFREQGILYVTDKEKDVADWENWLEHARPFQIRTELLDSNGVAKLLPQAHQSWKAGLWTPSDGRAEPGEAVPAMARDAQARGTELFANCAVRGLDLQGGRVTGVVTERGRVKANAVLLAGGAWARLFCKRHGIKLKSLNVKASVLRTDAAPHVLSGGFSTPDFSMRRRNDGGYSLARGGATTYQIVPDGLRWFTDFWPSYLDEMHRMKVRIGRTFFDELFQNTNWDLDKTSPFEITRILNPDPDNQVLDTALRKMRTAFPVLGGTTVAERWAGVIDATPDAVPVISEVNSTPGFFIASGFSGHGFGLGPGAGRLAAELVTGAAPCVDPTPFALSRF